MDAFLSIGNQQSANLPVVAPKIAEALIATAIGLVAAIPSVMAYKLFRAPLAGARGQLGRALRQMSRPAPSSGESRSPWPWEPRAGGAGGRSRRLGGMNEINVTPLIDVMLVLLVIFMVTAPLMTTGVEVDLPKAKSAPCKPTTPSCSSS